MRKNNKIAVITMAVAVMMAATACGSKDTSNTTAVETTMETTTAAETTTEESTEEETEESTEAKTPDVGTMDAGVFKNNAGTYQIAVPEGWNIEEGSDEEIVTFISKEGSDMLEITTVEGEDADGAREVYPDTVEEYQELVSRGEEELEFVRYDVKNGDNGSQTFRYAIRYTNPEDGIRYYAVSGSYDAAAKKYVCAAGTIESEGNDLEAAIESALDSLSIK